MEAGTTVARPTSSLTKGMYTFKLRLMEEKTECEYICHKKHFPWKNYVMKGGTIIFFFIYYFHITVFLGGGGDFQKTKF